MKIIFGSIFIATNADMLQLMEEWDDSYKQGRSLARWWQQQLSWHSTLFEPETGRLMAYDKPLMPFSNTVVNGIKQHRCRNGTTTTSLSQNTVVFNQRLILNLVIGDLSLHQPVVLRLLYILLCAIFAFLVPFKSHLPFWKYIFCSHLMNQIINELINLLMIYWCRVITHAAYS